MQMLQAVRDRIICADIEISDETESGIYIGKAAETPISVVISTGPEVSEDIKPGMKILWWRDRSTEFIWDDGWKLNVVRERDVVGVVESGKTFNVIVSDPKGHDES